MHFTKYCWGHKFRKGGVGGAGEDDHAAGVLVGNVRATLHLGVKAWVETQCSVTPKK
jgi:hypothetical protein